MATPSTTARMPRISLVFEAFIVLPILLCAKATWVSVGLPCPVLILEVESQTTGLTGPKDVIRINGGG